MRNSIRWASITARYEWWKIVSIEKKVTFWVLNLVPRYFLLGSGTERNTPCFSLLSGPFSPEPEGFSGEEQRRFSFSRWRAAPAISRERESATEHESSSLRLSTTPRFNYFHLDSNFFSRYLRVSPTSLIRSSAVVVSSGVVPTPRRKSEASHSPLFLAVLQ